MDRQEAHPRVTSCVLAAMVVELHDVEIWRATSCVRLSLGCGGCVHPVPEGYQHCITAVAKQITIALATTGQNLDAATLTHTLQSNATSHNLLITSFGLRELPLI
jgi:hypothetical protein